MLTPWTLLLAQITAHLGFLFLCLAGSVREWCFAFVVYFFTGCFGMTMTYHRLLSHRSWNAPIWFERAGTLFATLGMTGSAISWVAIHRKHHRFTDSVKDPHCPNHKGFMYCHWFSMFERVDLKYAVDLAKNRFYENQHRYYFLINGIYAIFLLVLDPRALVYAWLAPACILWNAGSSIVTFSHIYGSKDNPIAGNARNSWFLGWFVWGEGWHNNHHFQPQRASFSEKWWQFDAGGLFIQIFKKRKIS
ncbi:fatty acid desaturase [bacterium]|nr:fatty acid desaturase [bacterium]